MPPRQLHRIDDGGIVRLTIDRPEKRNALSHSLLIELDAALESLSNDARARVVVLGSTGSVFCSGHDLGEMLGRSKDDYHALFYLCSTVMHKLRRLPQPVIARVQGTATAAGCQLVAACDLVVASDSATFATPGVKIGLFCTTPMVPLVRAVPAKAAMEMLLTGRPISATQALHWGLINRVVSESQLDEAIREFTDAILTASPLTVKLGKQAFYDQLALAESDAYSRATDVMTNNACLHDAQEGIAAFLQKRRPNWSGE